MTFDTGNIMDFKSALGELRQATPGLPLREAAAELGISEGELLAAHCGDGVHRLDGDWLPLLSRLGTLGSMVILTRNEHAILQEKAPYSRLEVRGATAMAAAPGRGLDLQIEYWAHGFAVVEATGLRPSLQFFDGEGTAVHKVFLQETGAHTAFEALIRRHLNADQSPILHPTPGTSRPPAGVLSGETPHRLWRVEPASLGSLLLEAAGLDLQLEATVASPGASQTRWGPVGALHRRGPWLQILHGCSNLSFDLGSFSSAWVARAPDQEEGPYVLQLLDCQNEPAVELRGFTPAWNELLYALPVPEA